jgi:hypothetical protein
VEREERRQVRLEESGSHALVDHDIAALDLAALIEAGAARVGLDVLQRVGRVGASAPDAAISPESGYDT